MGDGRDVRCIYDGVAADRYRDQRPQSGVAQDIAGGSEHGHNGDGGFRDIAGAPAGYLNITLPNGAAAKVPYYNV